MRRENGQEYLQVPCNDHSPERVLLVVGQHKGPPRLKFTSWASYSATADALSYTGTSLNMAFDRAAVYTNWNIQYSSTAVFLQLLDGPPAIGAGTDMATDPAGCLKYRSSNLGQCPKHPMQASHAISGLLVRLAHG